MMFCLKFNLKIYFWTIKNYINLKYLIVTFLIIRVINFKLNIYFITKIQRKMNINFLAFLQIIMLILFNFKHVKKFLQNIFN